MKAIFHSRLNKTLLPQFAETFKNLLLSRKYCGIDSLLSPRILSMTRELRNGMIGGFIAIAWMLLLFFLKQEASGIGVYDSYFCIILITAFIYITILRKRDHDLNGGLTFREGMLTGIATSFIMGLVIGAYKLIYVKYLNPGIVDEAVNQAKSIAESAGGSFQQIKDAEDGTRASYSAFGQLTFGIGVTMLLGAVASLVCSVIMRREKSVGSEQ